MSACVCVLMSAHVCARVHVCCVHVCVCICVRVYYMHVCTCVHVSICICTRVYVIFKNIFSGVELLYNGVLVSAL